MCTSPEGIRGANYIHSNPALGSIFLVPVQCETELEQPGGSKMNTPGDLYFCGAFKIAGEMVYEK